MIVEFSELQQSGLSEMTQLVDLPSFELKTHENVQACEMATAYFLACISIRRIMNRVHGLLYQDDSSREQNMTAIVQELDHQLEEWYELLPPHMQFRRGLGPCQNDLQAHLSQRHNACKSTLFRFILQQTIQFDHDFTDGYVREACKSCLDACCLHILNVDLWPQVVFVDVWICALA